MVEQRREELTDPTEGSSAHPIVQNSSPETRLNFLRQTLKKIGKSPDKPEKTDQHIPFEFPHANSAIDKFRKYYPDAVENQQALTELLYGFFGDEINESQIYTTKDGQASFPHTSFNVTKFAEKIFTENGGTLSNPTGEVPKTTQHYNFGSFLNSDNGQFTFVEYAIHDYLKALPAILKDLEEGRKPPNIEIYTFGSPTSQFGTVDEEYAREAEKDPYPKLGQSYAELISSKIPQNTAERAKTNIILQGNSMGASLAAATAEALADQNLTTQTGEDRDQGKIYTQVLMDLPAGYHETWTGLRKMTQTKAGFGFDSLTGMAKPESRTAFFGEKTFMANVANHLKDAGYDIKMPPDQVYRKKKITNALIDGIETGIPFDTKKVKANIRQGIFDSTMISPSSLKDALPQRIMLSMSRVGRKIASSLQEHVRPEAKPRLQRLSERVKNRLGKTTVSNYILNVDNGTRTFAIMTNHNYPFYNQNELARWKNATDAYLELKKGSRQSSKNKPS